MRFIGIVFCAMYISFGCSSTQVIDNVNESTKMERFSNEIKGHSVIIRLNNGQRIAAESVVLRIDTTSFNESNSHIPMKIPTNTISRFQWNSHLVGIPKGIFFGVLIGGISTAVFRPKVPDLGGGAHNLPIIDGAIIGGAIGLVVGLAVGNETVYEVRMDSTGRSK